MKYHILQMLPCNSVLKSRTHPDIFFSIIFEVSFTELAPPRRAAKIPDSVTKIPPTTYHHRIFNDILLGSFVF
jgi:hypothetical protein